MDKIEYLVLDSEVIIRILAMTTLAFICAMLFTPFLTYWLYRFKFYKRVKDTAISGEKAEVYYNLHKYKEREIRLKEGKMVK